MWKAKIAVIRDDHTWTELITETDGANPSTISRNAVYHIKDQWDYFYTGKYPENIIGLHVLEMWQEDARNNL
jgi:hypothetical protein